jgi:hypothetical protein
MFEEALKKAQKSNRKNCGKKTVWIASIPIEREERDDIAKVKSPNLRWERSRKL